MSTSTFEEGLTTSEIEQLLDPIDEFCGVYPCDAIPRITQRPCAMVINTDSSHEPGEHWIVLILKPEGKALYFDSFGFPPLVPQIQMYLEKYASNGFKYNSITLQHPNSRACGYYCAAFITLWSKGCSLRMFCTYFSGRLGSELIRNDNNLMTLFSGIKLIDH